MVFRSTNKLTHFMSFVIILLVTATQALAIKLDVTARHDRPGPVQLRVDASDGGGALLLSATLAWGADDNSWGIQSLTLPTATATLRFTFINDQYTCCHPDTDRNAHIDFFDVGGVLREAESFDATGGTDIALPGCGIAGLDGRTVADCGNQNDWVEYQLGPGTPSRFFKASYSNFAPSGIPDFDQKQASWAGEITCGPNMTPDSPAAGDDIPLPGPCLSPDQVIVEAGPNGLLDTPLMGDDAYAGWEFCVPTAVANCLWWFDSKFEADPNEPACGTNDTYPMVTVYPLSSDDHCPDNVDMLSTPPGGVAPAVNSAFGELIEDLAWRMDTNGQRTLAPHSGTTASDVDAAVEQYLKERGLSDEYLVSLVRKPSFDFVSREVERSQDIILLLSFAQNCTGPVFLGGHAVTTAGVSSDPLDQELCLSDPFFDLAEAGSTGRVMPPPGTHGHAGIPETAHNDAELISHDCNPVLPAAGPFGQILMPNYGTIVIPGGPNDEPGCDDLDNFFGQSSWDRNDPTFDFGACDPGCPIETIVSYALEISPFFWKAGGFDDYASNGMPDFDQRQNAPAFTCPLDATWSHCGPVAMANSMWWFDSKLDPFQVPPPTVSDGYPMISSFGAWDDHDPSNTPPVIDDLAFKMNTNAVNPGFPPRPGGLWCGTYVDDMVAGINAHLAGAGLASDYFVDAVRAPDFDFVAAEVEKSQDVVLLLGFWQFQEANEGWTRIGGHYVTVAGVDRQGGLIAFSDPIMDANENGLTGGRVGGATPHGHPAAPPDGTHNDAALSSHDLFEVIATSSPGGSWGPRDYLLALGGDLTNFFGQNSSDDLDSEGHPVGPPMGPNPIVTEVDYAIEVSPCPPDLDGDGFDPLCDGDCNDMDPNIFPGATEICDGVDNNCDGTTDEGFDSDGDGVGNCLDCNDADITVWAMPSEVPNLQLTHAGGIAGVTTLAWNPPIVLGAAAIVYDTIGSPISNNFLFPLGPGICRETNDGTNTLAVHAVAIAAGTIEYFLIRAENNCPLPAGMGSVGTTSAGAPRAARTCP